MDDPLKQEPIPQIYAANTIVSQQWGVPAMTPFVKLEDVSPKGFAELKRLTWLQLDLERADLEIELSEDLPSAAETVLDLRSAFNFDSRDLQTEAAKRALHRYAFAVLENAINQARIKRAIKDS